MNTGFRSINLFADNLDQLPCFVRDWNMFSFLDGNYLCYSVAWKICFTGQTWNYFESEVVETPLFCQIRRQTL